ncbi:hypothetical protein [Reichenbachiella agariperforans]|uniref:hypothetical protein n=1 Tax=Reichenbachiella agariperforans TaxID=156994 RepID=UPI001C09F04E|nr:hypothetical protein [Reichenbachiella agariperforans]MBU2912738.1 hypothetical protein [Reichenbachiella agariperforans]
MGKKSRQARRQARKAKRAEQREQLKELISGLNEVNITDLPDTEEGTPALVEKFNEIWPILKPALKFAISVKLTGEKADKVLSEILKAGEVISLGGSDEAVSDFIEKFKDAWGTIEFVLGLIQILTPNNVDKVIDDVLEIGDWIAGE